MRSIPTRLRAAILILPVALALSAGCDIAMADFTEKETSEWRKSYELSPGGRVEIGNVNGRIRVQTGEGNTVEVVAVKTAKASNVDAAKQALGRIEIRESASPDGIKVETHFDRSGSSMFGHNNWRVEYTVRVPVSANVKLSTVNGGVEVTGVSGRVLAEATNGGVIARGISGTIEASTTNGGVDVELARVDQGGAKLECTNGGIVLALPNDSSATLSARVTNGGIDTGGLSIMARGENSRRRLDGDLNGGGPRISMECTNGGIELRKR
jgi:DUF4097 and DUF4098 domain-containing protein YvlB